MEKYLILYMLAPSSRANSNESRQKWELFMIVEGNNPIDAIMRSKISDGLPGIARLATVPWDATSIWERPGWSRLYEETFSDGK